MFQIIVINSQSNVLFIFGDSCNSIDEAELNIDRQKEIDASQNVMIDYDVCLI